MTPLAREPAPRDSHNRQLVSRLGSLPLEEVPCYLCGDTEGRVLVDDPPFKVRLCATCGLGYTSPRLVGDRIHEIYDNGYWRSESATHFGYSCYEEEVAGYLRTFRRKADIIQRFAPSGRVLEVGCAAGCFLAVMQERGYEVHGLEISAEIAESARRRFNLPHVESCLLADAHLEPGSFDVIALFDVIEHMADPISELLLCRDLLKPGGSLVIQTQDISSFTRKVMGRRWHHFKQLEHIYHFSPATLGTLLERSGFEVVTNSRRGAGKYVSFEFVSERSRRYGRIPGLLGRPLKLLGRRFLYVNPLDEMFVIARRAAEAPPPSSGPADGI